MKKVKKVKELQKKVKKDDTSGHSRRPLRPARLLLWRTVRVTVTSSSTVTVSLVTGVCVTVAHDRLDVVVVDPLLVQRHVLLGRCVGRLRPLVGGVCLRFVMGVSVSTMGVSVSTVGVAMSTVGVTVVTRENLELETV